MDDNDKDLRKARLYGGASGIATSEAEIIPRLLAQSMGGISEVGESAYPEVLRGQRLALVDPRFWLDIRKMRNYLNAPSIPVVVGDIDYTIPPEGREFLKRLNAQIGLRAKSYAGAGHEIGHSVPSPIRSLGMSLGTPLAKILGVLAGVGTATLSDDPTMESIAPLISAAPYAAELAEEARATAHGVRAVRAVKGNMAALEALGRLLPAFMTYAAMAAPALAAPMVAKAVKHYVKDKDAKKTAAKIPSPAKATGRKILSARQEWASPAPSPKTSKIGDPGMNPAKPPSKSKFYKDMLSMMSGKGARRNS